MNTPQSLSPSPDSSEIDEITNILFGVAIGPPEHNRKELVEQWSRHDFVIEAKQKLEALMVQARIDENWQTRDYVTRTSYDTTSGRKIDDYLDKRIEALRTSAEDTNKGENI